MTFENIKNGDIISYIYGNDIDEVHVDIMRIEEIITNQDYIIIKTVVLSTTNPDFTLFGHHDIFNIPLKMKNLTEYNSILLSSDNNDIQLKKKKTMSKLFICHNAYYRKLKKSIL